MVSEQLNSIILNEYSALKKLLKTLNEQFDYITKRNVFALDAVREKIENCASEVAKYEVERRKITDGRLMSTIVSESGDKTLEKSYEKIQNLLHQVQLQKDTNEILIRQGLNYTTQMLGMLNPNRSPKTYNAYGRSR
ncbi:flagellar protein FlgN [Clostridium sp. JN-1]|jgi:flagellar biosynthesis/type III secretory pathway chaperone|uniref:flagellar protein FlgN n=1 Tax=Clostridium sp. JN-1 TaxID=2483110 RepID=UPI000F0BBC5C|nr:flagellar protein FlgN [Clostridium sp. JN-1]